MLGRNKAPQEFPWMMELLIANLTARVRAIENWFKTTDLQWIKESTRQPTEEQLTAVEGPQFYRKGI